MATNLESDGADQKQAKSAQEILTGNTMSELLADLKAATANLNQAASREVVAPPKADIE